MKHLVLLASVCLLAAGCISPFPDMVEPVYEVPEDDYLVVFPIKEQDFPSPWDSPMGHYVAQRVSETLATEADFMTAFKAWAIANYISLPTGE